jgi:hypothetical protein
MGAITWPIKYMGFLIVLPGSKDFFLHKLRQYSIFRVHGFNYKKRSGNEINIMLDQTDYEQTT